MSTLNVPNYKYKYKYFPPPKYIQAVVHSFGVAFHLEGIMDVYQKTFQTQCNTDTDERKESWIYA